MPDLKVRVHTMTKSSLQALDCLLAGMQVVASSLSTWGRLVDESVKCVQRELKLVNFESSAGLQGSLCLQLAMCTNGTWRCATYYESKLHGTHSVGSLVRCTLNLEEMCCTCSQSACLGKASRSGRKL